MNIKTTHFIALTGVVGAAIISAGLLKNSDSSTTSLSSSISNSVAHVASIANTSIKDTVSPSPDFLVNEQSLLLKKHSISAQELQEVGGFNVDTSKNISQQVSVIQLEKKNPFLSLVALGEGFKPVAYDDNKGLATGFGYNISMQSGLLNEQIFSAISSDTKAVAKAKSLSGVMDTDKVDSQTRKELGIVAQRAAQVSHIMMYEFTSGAINTIGLYAKTHKPQARQEMQDKSLSAAQWAKAYLDSLAPHQKAAVIYHTYKVGAGGLAKYTTLLSNLVDYKYNSTEDQAQKVAQHFTYKYSIKSGQEVQVKQDTRAQALVSMMFLYPQEFLSYAQKQSTIPPKTRALLAKVAPNTLDSSGAVVDEIGDFKQEAQKNGNKYSIDIDTGGLFLQDKIKKKTGYSYASSFYR